MWHWTVQVYVVMCYSSLDAFWRFQCSFIWRSRCAAFWRFPHEPSPYSPLARSRSYIRLSSVPQTCLRLRLRWLMALCIDCSNLSRAQPSVSAFICIALCSIMASEELILPAKCFTPLLNSSVSSGLKIYISMNVLIHLLLSTLLAAWYESDYSMNLKPLFYLIWQEDRFECQCSLCWRFWTVVVRLLLDFLPLRTVQHESYTHENAFLFYRLSYVTCSVRTLLQLMLVTYRHWFSSFVGKRINKIFTTAEMIL